MAEATSTRRQRRAAALQDAILLAAQKELRERGADGLAVEQVANRADVALQTVYNHFGGRTGLLLAVAGQALETDGAFMDEAYATPDPVERVKAAARAYGAFALRNPEQFRLLAFPPGPPYEPEGAGATAVIAQRVADGVRLQNARLAGALREAMAAGTAQAGDADRIATALWAMLNGLLALSWRADPLRTDPAATEALLDLAVEILHAGVTAGAAFSPAG